MNPWALVWLAVFAVAALLFFGAAIVIIVVGTSDLKDLLTTSARAKRTS
jgi:hypothetical protein